MAQGIDAAKPFIKILCDAQQQVASHAAKETREFPLFLDYTDDIYEAVASEFSDELAKVLTIAGKAERESETDRVKAAAKERLSARFEGQDKEISGAFRALTKKLVRERIIRDGLRIDGRGLADIRQLSAEIARAAPGARLRAVPAG